MIKSAATWRDYAKAVLPDILMAGAGAAGVGSAGAVGATGAATALGLGGLVGGTITTGGVLLAVLAVGGTAWAIYDAVTKADDNIKDLIKRMDALDYEGTSVEKVVSEWLTELAELQKLLEEPISSSSPSQRALQLAKKVEIMSAGLETLTEINEQWPMVKKNVGDWQFGVFNDPADFEQALKKTYTTFSKGLLDARNEASQSASKIQEAGKFAISAKKVLSLDAKLSRDFQRPRYTDEQKQLLQISRLMVNKKLDIIAIMGYGQQIEEFASFLQSELTKYESASMKTSNTNVLSKRAAWGLGELGKVWVAGMLGPFAPLFAFFDSGIYNYIYKDVERLIAMLENLNYKGTESEQWVTYIINELGGYVEVFKGLSFTRDPKEKLIAMEKKVSDIKKLDEALMLIQNEWPENEPNLTSFGLDTKMFISTLASIRLKCAETIKKYEQASGKLIKEVPEIKEYINTAKKIILTDKSITDLWGTAPEYDESEKATLTLAKSIVSGKATLNEMQEASDALNDLSSGLNGVLLEAKRRTGVRAEVNSELEKQAVKLPPRPSGQAGQAAPAGAKSVVPAKASIPHNRVTEEIQYMVNHISKAKDIPGVEWISVDGRYGPKTANAVATLVQALPEHQKLLKKYGIDITMLRDPNLMNTYKGGELLNVTWKILKSLSSAIMGLDKEEQSGAEEEGAESTQPQAEQRAVCNERKTDLTPDEMLACLKTKSAWIPSESAMVPLYDYAKALGWTDDTIRSMLASKYKGWKSIDWDLQGLREIFGRGRTNVLMGRGSEVYSLSKRAEINEKVKEYIKTVWKKEAGPFENLFRVGKYLAPLMGGMGWMLLVASTVGSHTLGLSVDSLGKWIDDELHLGPDDTITESTLSDAHKALVGKVESSLNPGMSKTAGLFSGIVGGAKIATSIVKYIGKAIAVILGVYSVAKFDDFLKEMRSPTEPKDIDTKEEQTVDVDRETESAPVAGQPQSQQEELQDYAAKLKAKYSK